MASLIKLSGLLLITFLLSSCGGETIRTETEYMDVATEAHATGDSRRAIIELAAGIRHFPKNADLQLLRGRIFLDLEDGAGAEVAFNKAIALGYNREFIKHELAESWLYQQNPAKVVQILEEEILQGSEDALIYEVVGRAYIALRDQTNPTLFIRNMDTAEVYIDEAYKLNPNNSRVLITKAWIPAMMGKLEEAITWLDKANLIIKDQRQNLAMKGEIYIRQNKIDLAQKVYKKLTTKFPQHPQYKLELGYTYLLNNQYDKARQWIEPVATQYPTQLRPKYLMANISLMEKNYEEAKRLSDEVLVKAPNDLKTIIINGASSYFLNDLENAYQKLSHFYNRTKSIPSLKLLTATKLKLNDNEAASEMLEGAGQNISEQTDIELLNLVAIASAKVGKMDVALEAYQKLVQQDPNITSFKNNLGILQIAQGDYDEGFDNLENALKDEESNKDDPGHNFKVLAQKALRARQYDLTADYIKQYKKAAPESYKPYILSAVLHAILKNNDIVRQEFNKAMELAPDVASIKARYAIFEKTQGNEDKSLKLARESLELDPSDVGSGKILLPHLLQQKKTSEVKEIIDNAISYDKAPHMSKLIFADYYTILGRPQNTLSVINQLPDEVKKTYTYKLISGKAYLRNGQGQQAIEMLEAFSLEYPKNIQVLKYLLQGYQLTNNIRRYKKTLETINSLEPNSFGIQMELARIYLSAKEYTKAKEMLAAIKTKNDTEDTQKKILLATIKTSQSSYHDALSIIAPLYDKYPENGGISLLYARNLALTKQVNKAIKVSKSWADAHPNNVAVKQFLGDLYMRNEDHENARLQYEIILSSSQKLPPSIILHSENNLANIYMDKKQLDQAMQHAQNAVDMAPNNPNIMDTYANILLLQGQHEKAVQHFDQALALLKTDDRRNHSTFSLGKAKALIQGGNNEQARKILNRLLNDDPDFPQAEEVKQLLADL